MKMKLFIILIFFVKCSYTQTEKSNIDNFFSKFISRELPFEVSLDSLYYFGKTNINSEGNYLPSKFQDLGESDIVNIPAINKSLDKEHNLRNSAICKFEILENFTLLLYNREIYTEDFDSFSYGTSESLILCTYNNVGKLTDTLTLAGYVLPNIEQLGKITKDLHITTKRYFILPDDSIPGLNANETINDYYINDKGKFILISTLTKKGKFFIDDNGYKEYDK